MYQTATDWLFKQLWEEPKDKMVWYAILKQAKEMEKEQIINLFKHAQVLHTMKDQMRGEQYYQETYGK